MVFFPGAGVTKRTVDFEQASRSPVSFFFAGSKDSEIEDPKLQKLQRKDSC